MLLELSKDEIVDINEIVHAVRQYSSIRITIRGGYWFEYKNKDDKQLDAVYQVIYDHIKDRK